MGDEQATHAVSSHVTATAMPNATVAEHPGPWHFFSSPYKYTTMIGHDRGDRAMNTKYRVPTRSSQSRSAVLRMATTAPSQLYAVASY